MKNSKRIISAIVATTMILPLAGCNKESSKSGKVDVDSVLEVTEDLTSALKKADFKKMKKMADEFDEDALDELVERYEANKEFNDDLLDNVKFDFDEDSVDTSKKGGSVEVSYKYYNPEDAMEYDDIDDAIDELDMEEDTFTIEFELDDDDIIITNFDDITSDFYDVVIAPADADVYSSDSKDNNGGSASIVDPVDDDYSFFAYGDQYVIGADESFSFSIDTYENFPSDGEVEIEVYDEDYNCIYSTATKLTSDDTFAIEITPSMIFSDGKFEPGFYEVDISLVGSEYCDYVFFEVEGDSTPVSVPAGSWTGEELEAYSGYILNGVYYNPALGVSFVVGSDFYVYTDEEIWEEEDRYAEYAYLDEVVENPENSGGVIIIVSDTSELLDMLNAQGGVLEELNINGFKVYLIEEYGDSVYIIDTGDICIAMGFEIEDSATTVWMDSVVSSISEY